MTLLKRAVSVITGAGKLHGIGAATALRLARKQHHLVLNFRNESDALHQLEKECSALGSKVLLVQGDISEEATCKKIIARSMETFQRIDHIINNAGTTVFDKSIESQTPDVMNSIFNTNLFGPFMMARLAAPYMEKEGGSLTHISSMAGISGGGSSVAYDASKAALNTMTLSLAKLFPPTTRVNTICPSVVSTGWWDVKFKNAAEKTLFFEKVKAVPPEKVAEAVEFLMNHSEITGRIVYLGAKAPDLSFYLDYEAAKRSKNMNASK